MRREDFNSELLDDVLTTWGDKQFDREAASGRYGAVQCAYGSFRRDVALALSVKPTKTKASYRDGVLCIERPKAGCGTPACQYHQVHRVLLKPPCAGDSSCPV